MRARIPPKPGDPSSATRLSAKAPLGKSSAVRAPDGRLRLSRATGKSPDWQAPESPRSMHAGDEQTRAILGRQACSWQILPGGSTKNTEAAHASPVTLEPPGGIGRCGGDWIR